MTAYEKQLTSIRSQLPINLVNRMVAYRVHPEWLMDMFFEAEMKERSFTQSAYSTGEFFGARIVSDSQLEYGQIEVVFRFEKEESQSRKE